MRFALAALLCTGCVTGAALRARSAAVEQDLKLAREQNADTCAGRELAVAEANLEFSRLELEQGDAFRAGEHLDLAQKSAKDAVAKSKDCGKVTVLIREKEAPQITPKVQLKDTDGDGVPDLDDLCPDVPGPKENHGCPVLTDKDGDGVTDDIDRCPDKPGPKENFGCPWPDRDGDGVPDNEDKCPDAPGPLSNHGCPLSMTDRDHDGVMDDKDLCPDEPGPVENAGCPWKDRDHDGVPDKDDQCPDAPGPADNHGCPRPQKLIVVKRDRIDIKKQVRFAPNKSVILPSSFELLKEVANAIKDVPNIAVRVEGHTDNVGKLQKNMKLSQERADAVKAFLVAQGVEAKRITAQGFGPTRPIASNATKAGKSANRRVEFRIVEAAQ